MHTNQLARRVCCLCSTDLNRKLNVGKIKYFPDDATETTRPFGQPLCLVAEEPASVAPPPRKGVRKKK